MYLAGCITQVSLIRLPIKIYPPAVKIYRRHRYMRSSSISRNDYRLLNIKLELNNKNKIIIGINTAPKIYDWYWHTALLMQYGNITKNITYLRHRTLLPKDVADEYILQVVPCNQVVPEPFCWLRRIMWWTTKQKCYAKCRSWKLRRQKANA